MPEHVYVSVAEALGAIGPLFLRSATGAGGSGAEAVTDTQVPQLLSGFDSGIEPVQYGCSKLAHARMLYVPAEAKVYAAEIVVEFPAASEETVFPER